MASENEYLEEDQNVTENVNVSEADNQQEYVNVEENVVEVDNLAVVRISLVKRIEWSRHQNNSIRKNESGTMLLINQRRQNLFDLSPRMRTTQHVPDRPPPLDETHLPFHHHSLGGTQSEVQSSGDNHRTSSPTRLCQPPPPSVDRRQHSKRSKRRSRREDCAEHVSDPYSHSDAFEAANRGYDANHTKGFAHTMTAPITPSLPPPTNQRRQNLFDVSPRMRITQHVPDRPPPLDEIHLPLHHHSLGGTQSEVQSSGDNHRTSSPTRLCQPPPPSVDRRQHSKRSKIPINYLNKCASLYVRRSKA
ncbi:hypothetical protein LWI28_023395 [Acer negundo]|uniref:Uncharacterized protein n=1 Tax=Acer negundo TaxID=4023 RepID=A0AAD5J713_ACENE|nr:hypothetical protein LWI28_023395 [Acer negundo]